MVDPVLGLWGWRLRAKLRFVSEHRALMTGFCLMAALLLAVPLLNLMILPIIGTIGATALALAVTQAQPPALLCLTKGLYRYPAWAPAKTAKIAMERMLTNE